MRISEKLRKTSSGKHQVIERGGMVKSNIYLFKKQGTASLLVASGRKANEVRKYFTRAGYIESDVQRNQNGIPIANGHVKLIRHDVS